MLTLLEKQNKTRTTFQRMILTLLESVMSILSNQIDRVEILEEEWSP